MGGLVEAHQVLAQGNILSMMGDRAWGSRVQTHSFLGEPAPFPVTPYRLAVKAGARIILLLTVRTGRLAFRIETSYLNEDQERLEKMNANEAVTLLLARYVDALEQYVEKYPYMWFNIFNFWDTDKDEGESRY
jgi:predicted LPLAT superfamily acyltransferase